MMMARQKLANPRYRQTVLKRVRKVKTKHMNVTESLEDTFKFSSDLNKKIAHKVNKSLFIAGVAGSLLKSWWNGDLWNGQTLATSVILGAIFYAAGMGIDLIVDKIKRGGKSEQEAQKIMSIAINRLKDDPNLRKKVLEYIEKNPEIKNKQRINLGYGL